MAYQNPRKAFDLRFGITEEYRSKLEEILKYPPKPKYIEAEPNYKGTERMLYDFMVFIARYFKNHKR